MAKKKRKRKKKRKHYCPIEITTIQGGRDWIEANRMLAKICPCCDQDVKRYKHPLYAGYAACLVALVRLYKKEPRWYHVDDHVLKIIPKYHDMGKCKYFGLAEQCPNEDDPRRNYSGLWRPTQYGIDFVEGNAFIPMYMVRENRQLIRTEGAPVNIHWCLGKQWDYEELMNDCAKEA
jgi:hypothetical protein